MIRAWERTIQREMLFNDLGAESDCRDRNFDSGSMVRVAYGQTKRQSRVCIARRFTSAYGAGYSVTQCNRVNCVAPEAFNSATASSTSPSVDIPVDRIKGRPFRQDAPKMEDW